MKLILNNILNKRCNPNMIKVVYPKGKIVNYMWIDKKYGYIRRKGKVYCYSLPK